MAKFFYEVTLRRTEALQAIPCPKGEKRLPVVLSFDEVARFFDACQSPRHLTMFLCGYAGGMRVCHVRLPFTDLGDKSWQLTDQLHDASYDWNGNDLQSRGLFLDMAPWQASVFSLTQKCPHCRNVSNVHSRI